MVTGFYKWNGHKLVIVDDGKVYTGNGTITSSRISYGLMNLLFNKSVVRVVDRFPNFNYYVKEGEPVKVDQSPIVNKMHIIYNEIDLSDKLYPGRVFYSPELDMIFYLSSSTSPVVHIYSSESNTYSEISRVLISDILELTNIYEITEDNLYYLVIQLNRFHHKPELPKVGPCGFTLYLDDWNFSNIYNHYTFENLLYSLHVDMNKISIPSKYVGLSYKSINSDGIGHRLTDQLYIY